MKHLSILVPEGENNLSSIVGPFKIFHKANSFWAAKNGHVLFAIDLVGQSSNVDFYEGIFSVKPTKNLVEIECTDLIIIPSLNHNYVHAIENNKDLIEWLIDQHSRGAEIASICTGSFLLAAAGLLDGRSASTHWSAVNEFTHRFPRVKLMADRVLTDEHGIYTNGGAYSFLNLVIYLIEKYFDRETAIYCAKVFQIDYDRNSQSAFMIFNGHKNHGDKIILQAQEYIETNYAERILIDQLSSQFFIVRRSFDRRFIKATGFTPLEYLQSVRIEAAKQLLERSDSTVNEVMYKVGFTDARFFRTLFTRLTGLSPMKYRGKFGKKVYLTETKTF